MAASVLPPHLPEQKLAAMGRSYKSKSSRPWAAPTRARARGHGPLLQEQKRVVVDCSCGSSGWFLK